MTEPKNPAWRNLGVIVSHAAHAVMIAGMVQRFRPHILVLGRTPEHEPIVLDGLSRLGLRDRATFLDFTDDEAYVRILDGDFGYHVSLGRQVTAWLNETQPDAIVGDAFELSNFQHDAGRLMVDKAVKSYKPAADRAVNYETPICCRTDGGTENLFYQRFPYGDHAAFHLNDAELSAKTAIAQWASLQNDFIAHVCPLIPDAASEPYRIVPPERDYTRAPAGIRKHYDDRGREEVALGTYEQPILFEEHFVPLARHVQSLESL